MSVIKSQFLFSLCFIMIFTALVGCNSNHEVDVSLKNEQLLETTIQELEMLTQPFHTNQTETDNGLFYGEPPEPVEQAIPITKEKELSSIKMRDLLKERFGEHSKISYIPDMDKREEEVWYYCFSVDYSNIVGRDTPLTYCWINPDTEEAIFQEAGYIKTGSPQSYTNIPDDMFPIPMVNDMEIPYEWFLPPDHDNDVTITYVYDDTSVMESYQLQLKEAGFIDYGAVQSVESLWIYERNEDGATLVIEMYTYDEGFGVVMYVNYLKN